ncbi:MAG TPA: DUF2835 family protein [Geothrix sp.]
MQRFEFPLSISADSYLDYYRGAVKQVIARCPDGRTVQFPAALLQPFVTPAGIHGEFVLTCGDDNKGAVLRRRSREL